MNNRLKKLYENIMKNVAKQVKHTLNEANDINLNTGNTMSVTSDSTRRSLNAYLNSIRSTEQLSQEDEIKLVNIITTSDDARAIQKAKDILVTANLKLVISTAKHYNTAKKVELEDIIQAGNEGLIEATNHVDAEKMTKFGNKFSALAIWYIRRSIMTLIDEHSYGFKLTSEMATIVRNISYFKDKFFTENQRMPNAEEIFAGIKNKKCFNGNLTLDKVKLAMSNGGYNDDSMDDVVYQDDNGDNVNIGDQTENNTFDDPDSELLNTQAQRQFELLAIKVLGERNGNILLDKFGVNGRREKNTWEIAEDWNITTVMVNKILRDSYVKLAKIPEARKLLTDIRDN